MSHRFPFLSHRSSPGAFHLIPHLRQLRLHLLAVVALNFDDAVFDRSAGAAEFFQLLPQRYNRLVAGPGRSDAFDDDEGSELVPSPTRQIVSRVVGAIWLSRISWANYQASDKHVPNGWLTE